MIILNLAVTLITGVCIALYLKTSPAHLVFRYFTVLSNCFSALLSLAAALFRLFGEVPQIVLLIKYSATVCVSVTLSTVMLFLGPIVYGYKSLFHGPDLFMHLICPLMAIVNHFAWDKPAGPFAIVFLGALPVLLYALLYMTRVIYRKTWDDFYAFNRDGRWPVSFALMMVLALVLAILLWVL